MAQSIPAIGSPRSSTRHEIVSNPTRDAATAEQKLIGQDELLGPISDRRGVASTSKCIVTRRPTVGPPSVAPLGVLLVLCASGQYDLQCAGLPSISEGLIGLHELLESEVVSDELRSVELVRGHEAQQRWC